MSEIIHHMKYLSSAAVAAIGYKSGVETSGFARGSRSRCGRQRIMGSPIVHFKHAAKLKEFYAQLFDWKIGDLMPDMGNYALIDPESSGLAGGIGQSDNGQ